MRTFLLTVFIFLASDLIAQRECASADYTELQKALDPSFSQKLNDIEHFIHRIPETARMNGENHNIIHIPVVVHVLYKTADQNISDAQIESQIDAMNRDFRRKNADTVNTPERFRSVAADVQIEFALATADPSGRSTTGIIRKQTNQSFWTMDDKIKFTSQGGDNAWDSRYYLNIWVGNMISLLGYASVPGSPADKDGVVILYSAFGTINTNSPFNLGRTTVHEVGHWLGLKHIWGDTFCGDDLVNDTPRQGNFTRGCPNGFRSSCSNGSMGDMYMNYMDYTNDACLNMFTNGQKARMLSLFGEGGPRNSFFASKGLNDPWNFEAPVTESPAANPQFRYFPNPAIDEVVLNFDDASWIGKTISIVNMNGIVLLKVELTAKSQRISLKQLKAGMYFIQGENAGKKVSEKLIRL